MRFLLLISFLCGCVNSTLVVSPAESDPGQSVASRLASGYTGDVLAGARAAVDAAAADNEDAFRAAVEPILNDPNAVLALVARSQQSISDDDRSAILSTAALAIRAYAAAPTTKAFGDAFDATSFFAGLRALLPTCDTWVDRGLTEVLLANGVP